MKCSTGKSSIPYTKQKCLWNAGEIEYNHKRPHSALGYRPPAPEAVIPPDSVSRPMDNTTMNISIELTNLKSSPNNWGRSAGHCGRTNNPPGERFLFPGAIPRLPRAANLLRGPKGGTCHKPIDRIEQELRDIPNGCHRYGQILAFCSVPGPALRGKCCNRTARRDGF